ncbi:MAG: adenosylcobinamide-phosphate synthase CbiB [Desertimonas sp.]
MTRLGRRGCAVAAGWAIDRMLGEPPARWHPVAAFGRIMTSLERHTYRPNRAAGVVHAGIAVGGAALAGWLAERTIGPKRALAAAVTVSVAGRMLADEAAATLRAVDDGDLDLARRRVQTLVGRDPDLLEPRDVIRAVIESVAENTVDAVVAPMWWGVLAGAPGVLAHRAANTLDAMVGHRSPRYRHFGWAAARLDDVANYLPARLGVLAVVALSPGRARTICGAVRDDAPAHPSPNGGVIEAAVAAALDIRLGGRNVYQGTTEHRGVLGDGAEPDVEDGERAIRLTTRVGMLVAVTTAAGGMLVDRTPRRGRPIAHP